MAGRRPMPEAERFMGHVAKDANASGCWRWTAFCMKNGYGNFRTPLRHELAHRAAYRLFKGELRADLDVMHSCDNPSCVNPAHLSLGTRGDNMADAKAKGRTARGISHGMSKISESDAIAIRSADRPQAELAEQFGLAQGTISQIRSGKRWAHLQATGGHHR